MLATMFAGLAVVVMLLLVMARMNIRRWLGYANFVDILFTVGLIVLFHGTFSGVVAAAFAGIWMSISLQVLRKIVGIERYEWNRVSWKRGFVHGGWHYYAPGDLTWFKIRDAEKVARA